MIEKFKELFPSLFPDGVIDFYLKSEWELSVRDLCDNLLATPHGDEIVVREVKSRFGRLRFYYEGGTDLHRMLVLNTETFLHAVDMAVFHETGDVNIMALMYGRVLLYDTIVPEEQVLYAGRVFGVGKTRELLLNGFLSQDDTFVHTTPLIDRPLRITSKAWNTITEITQEDLELFASPTTSAAATKGLVLREKQKEGETDE